METYNRNIQNVINRAANESLRKIKIKCRRKYLKIMDEEKQKALIRILSFLESRLKMVSFRRQ
jgi:vacuolar-type H+-ATPase subunit E/Vma4